jgi:CRP-like cAMP-binding protein
MFSKVLDLDKSNIAALNNLSVCHIKLSDLNEAIKGFHQMIQLDKTLEASYFNIALSYLVFDKPQEALLCLKSSEETLQGRSQSFKDLEKFIQNYSQAKNKKLLSSKRFLKNSEYEPVFTRKSPAKKTEEVKVNKSPGLNQSPVNSKSTSPIFDEEVIDKMRTKMTKLRTKVYKDIKNLIKKDIPKTGKLESKYLTQEELKDLKIEFSRLPGERDYEKVEKILTKISFFQKYPKHVKQQIFEIGEVRCFLPGEVIFAQGEVGDSMYVVLKGAITIEKEGSEFGGKKIVINSLYDGRQFGELALLNGLNSKASNNERTASCIAFEKTYLFCMPKLNLSEIVLLSNKRELDDKLEFFSSLTFFRGINRNMLMALASNIETTIFKLNEVLIHKGEVPAGLFIIKHGHVGLFTEGFTVKNRYNDEFSPVRSQKPRPPPMYFIRNPPERLKKSTPNKSQTPESSSARLSSRDKERLDNGGHLVKERISFASLKESDFFGGRTILQGFTHDGQQIHPSKFTITAQSTIVEVFIITRYHLQFLTQEMSLQFFTILEKSYEIDCPEDIDAGEMDKLFQSWQDYKSQLLNGIRKDNFMAKHKINFPFVFS